MILNPELTIVPNRNSNTKHQWPFRVSRVDSMLVNTANRIILVRKAANGMPPDFAYISAKSKSSYPTIYTQYVGSTTKFELYSNNIQYLIDRSEYTIQNNNLVKTKNVRPKKPEQAFSSSMLNVEELTEVEIKEGEEDITRNGYTVLISNLIYAGKYASEDTFLAMISKNGSTNEAARYTKRGMIISHGNKSDFDIIGVAPKLVEVVTYVWYQNGYVHTDGSDVIHYFPSELKNNPKIKYQRFELDIEIS
jgi:hypothetical protein